MSRANNSKPKEEPASLAEIDPENNANSLVKEATERHYAEKFRRQIQILAMSLLVVVLVIYLLTMFAVILQQLLIALFLLYLILPARRWLKHRYQLSRLISYLIISLGVIAITWIMTLLVQENLADFNRKWPQYEKTLGGLIDQTSEWIPISRPGELKEAILGKENPEPRRPETVRTALMAFVHAVEQVMIVLIFLAFLLAEQGMLTTRIKRSFEEERAENILTILQRINASISKYITAKTASSLLMGVLTTLALLPFRVDYAILWGVIAFLLNYIPYLGAIVAITIPSLLAMLQFESVALGLVIFLILNLIHTVIGYWLEPVLFGERLNLSPFIVIFSLAFWGVVWGVPGMILAVPLMVSIKIILENIPATQPIAGLLSNIHPEDDPKKNITEEEDHPPTTIREMIEKGTEKREKGEIVT